ncbi:hypothetical protein BH20ACT18_BH20ACT18_07520 [soil metagenome]
MLDRLRDRLRRPLDRAHVGANGPRPELLDEHGREARPPLPALGDAQEATLAKAPGTEADPEEEQFEHAPDATPDEVASPKKIGFDGREIREHGPQSGHTPSGGGMGAGF